MNRGRRGIRRSSRFARTATLGSFCLHRRRRSGRHEHDHRRDESTYSVFIEVDDSVIFVTFQHGSAPVLSLRYAGLWDISGHV
jgi:hypothetical protein